MNLPPSLEQFIGYDICSIEQIARIAHEACRLQRNADYAEWNQADFEQRNEPFRRSLVVPSTENSV